MVRFPSHSVFRVWKNFRAKLNSQLSTAFKVLWERHPVAVTRLLLANSSRSTQEQVHRLRCRTLLLTYTLARVVPITMKARRKRLLNSDVRLWAQLLMYASFARHILDRD